jgi:ADP-ribosyl-[dinitrogen reductase] hydrolase
MPSSRDRALGALLGLAVGDAVGTTVEFKPRGSFAPLTDMVGGGPFRLEPGQWTDDTSMALCLAASLVETGRFDAHDQMTRYVRWRDEGYMSSNGRCFDIGTTVGAALARFERTGDPFAGSTDPHSAGNGSIMRLAPVVLWGLHQTPNTSTSGVSNNVTQHAAESSRTTHAAAECLDACRLLASVISRALAGASKDEALLGDAATFTGAPAIAKLARGAWRDKADSHIRGTGYVVQSLEAALWSVWTTGSFEEAILRAANLGEDADTTAAVAGQIAGALYGRSGIPARWLKRLAMREEIEGLGASLTSASETS